MTRQDFIFRLFDNENGLTLDQIEHVEELLPETIPDGLIQDIIDRDGCTDEEAAEIALLDAREVALNNMKDYAGDMLSLRDLFREYYGISLSDHQVRSLFFVLS